MSAPRTAVMPCRHGGRHPHGSGQRYKADGCRCQRCCDAYNARARERRRLAAYGRWEPFVDAEPVRQHVRDLRAAGIGLHRVAELAGMGGGALTRLVYGVNGKPPSARVLPATRDAILAVRPTELAPRAYVDATGTRRRLQALAVIGWTSPAMGRVLGLDRHTANLLLAGGAKTTRATADAVAADFDRMLQTGPPTGDRWLQTGATKARRAAAAAGWLPAAAWDDFDDVDAQPEAPGEVDAMAALAEDVEWLIAAGGTWHSVPGRVGRTRVALDRALHRAGRHDLVAALTTNTHGSAAA